MVVVLRILAILIVTCIRLAIVGMMFILMVAKMCCLLNKLTMRAVIRHRAPRGLERQQKHKEHEDE